MRFWFNPSAVGNVIVRVVNIRKGYSQGPNIPLTVFVYDGEEKTLCGTVTGTDRFYYGKVVECGGTRGDSVRIEAQNIINIFEINFYLSQGKIIC